MARAITVVSRMGPAMVVVTAVAAFLIGGAGCRKPTDVIPLAELRAASMDSTHIEISFPEPLDPDAMADPDNYRVEMRRRGRSSIVYPVFDAAVVDTLSGLCVRLETSSIPDAVSLVVTVSEIRLLTGQRLGPRDAEVGMVTGLSYGKDIGPLFAATCNRCHSGETPPGEYRTDSYFALFGAGTSPPENMLPGDPNSLLIEVTEPGATMFHQGRLDFIDAGMIENWVVYYLARL